MEETMKVKKQGNVFVVKTQYSEGGYEESRKYYFHSLEKVEEFINGCWTVDIYDDKQFISYYEIIVDVYERVDYSVEYK